MSASLSPVLIGLAPFGQRLALALQQAVAGLEVPHGKPPEVTP